MQDLVIEPQEGKKGRSFQATQVACVLANSLFEESGGNTIRPVWAMFAGSEAQLRPFMANLRLGRKAEVPSYRRSSSERYEFLKSVGFHVSWQKELEGSLATIYHPELFRLDPGMVDPTGIRFVMLVPDYWIAQQKVETLRAVRYLKQFKMPEDIDLTQMVPIAHLFSAYLDRRTRCPLIADSRFYLQILCAALTQGLASFPSEPSNLSYMPRYAEKWGHNHHHYFAAKGLSEVGIRYAISFDTTHEDLENFLAEQVTFYFDHADQTGFTSLADKVDLSFFAEAV